MGNSSSAAKPWESARSVAHPLSPEESHLFLQLCSARDEDLPAAPFLQFAASQLNERFRRPRSLPLVAEADLRCITQSLALAAPSTLQPSSGHCAALHSAGLGYAAQPCPTHCFTCQQPLQLVHSKPDPTFYPPQGQGLPQQGKLYDKRCRCRSDSAVAFAVSQHIPTSA